MNKSRVKPNLNPRKRAKEAMKAPAGSKTGVKGKVWGKQNNDWSEANI